MANITIRQDGQIIRRDGSNPIITNPDGSYGDQIPFNIDPTDPSAAPQAANVASGLIDLTNNTNWMQNPLETQGLLNEIPFIDIRVFQPRFSSTVTNLFAASSQLLDITESIANGTSALNGRVRNPYKNSVICRDLNWRLRLPILQQIPESRTSQFGAGEEGQSGAAIGSVARDFKSFIIENANAFTTSTGVARSGLSNLLGTSILENAPALANDFFRIFFPTFSAGTGEDLYFTKQAAQEFSIEIELINTSNDFRQSQWNMEFVKLCSLLFSSFDRNRYVTDSSCVVDLEINKVRYSPMATCSFSWEGIGNYIEIGDSEPMPEAIKCKFDFTEKVAPTRNLQLAYLINNEKLSMITTDTRALCGTLERAVSLGSDIARTF